MNPTQINPNSERRFEPGAKYWMRSEDGYVMPRSNSPYEAPEGCVPVVATSETRLDHDKEGLEVVPDQFDPTNANAVGSAVSYAGNHKVAGRDQSAPAPSRPMPVTLSNAVHDNQTRENMAQRTLRQAAMTPPPSDPIEGTLPPEGAGDLVNA